MKKIIAFTFLFFSLIANASALNCIPEKATTIIQSSNNEHRGGSMAIDTSFVLFKEKNKWMVKEKGSAQIVFDSCNDTGYLCEHKNGYLGNFVLRDNNQFAVFMMWDTDKTINDSDIQYILYAGKCL